MTIKLLLLPLILYTAISFISVDPDTQRFLDEYGRERFFHGTNAVQKSFPWYPPSDNSTGDVPYNEAIFDFFKEYGLNIIRLGTMWPGIEPTRGSFNQSYVDEIKKLIDEAGQRDIFTMADMHQDVYNRKECVEGFPDWSVTIDEGILKFPLPIDWPYERNSQGIPLNCSNRSWATYYFAKEASHNFQNLYDNYEGLADQMAKAWVFLAETLKENQHLIGYEMYNEPWLGDIYEKPWLLIPSIADHFNIQPLYDRLATQLRKEDDAHIIFFESITFDNFIPVGFTHVPGGREYENRSALSYHYYEPPDFWTDSFWKVRDLDVQRLKCGVLLSQFSIYEGADMMNKIMDHCDEYLHSWTSWEIHSLINSKMEPNLEVLKHVSRTYAQAVAGHALKQSFNSTNGVYQFEFTVNTSIEKPTQIYMNQKLHYPNGFDLTLTPAGGLTVTHSEKNKLLLEVNQQTKNGERYVLKMAPSIDQ